MTADLHEAAITYATLGWPVLPLYTWRAGRCACGQACASPAKHPLRDLAPNGLKNATTDIDRVDDWWTRYPKANIGLRTGDRFDVLDIDGDTGAANITALCDTHGTLPPGPVASTGGGGQHHLFLPTGVGNRAGVVPNVDWRGRNGYIVAAPSVHASGGAYTWTVDPDTPLEAAPPWLLEILNPPRPERGPRPAPASVRYLAVPGQGSRYGIAALEAELDELARAAVGTRNNELNSHAFNLYQLVAGGELDETFVTDRLTTTARTLGLEELEITGTLRSARCGGMESPRYAPALPARLAVGDDTTIATPEQQHDNQPTATVPFSSWLPIDTSSVIAGLLDGTIQRPTPTVGTRTDGQSILYPGRVNQLFSDPGTGKGWVALHITTQQLAAQRHVVYFDLEDTCDGILARLLDLGADPCLLGTHFHYITPEGPYGLDDQDALAGWLNTTRPTLGIVDSTGEAIAINGLKPNNDEEVAHWFRRLPHHLVEADVCVLLIDHVPKDREGRAMPIGSQRKLAAITGASFSVEPAVELGKGRAGIARLTTRKDRNGTFIRGHRAAEFHLDATTDQLHARLDPPPAAATHNGKFRPTHLMEKVSRTLEASAEPVSKRTLRATVRGDNNAKDQALEILLAEGYAAAARGGYVTVRAYREAPTEPDENPE